jgi:rRNA maturation endonuclease Nob1
MLAIFCRDCRKKFSDLTDFNEDRQSECPHCGSTFKFYHMLHMSPKDSGEMTTHTANLIHNKYNSVNFIFDK